MFKIRQINIENGSDITNFKRFFKPYNEDRIYKKSTVEFDWNAPLEAFNSKLILFDERNKVTVIIKFNLMYLINELQERPFKDIFLNIKGEYVDLNIIIQNYYKFIMQTYFILI